MTGALAAPAAGDPAESAIDLADRAIVALRAGRDSEARALLEEAGRAALALPHDDRDAPHVLANWAQQLVTEGRWESAEAIAAEAAARATGTEDPSTRLWATRILADACRLQGRTDDAANALAVARALLARAPSGGVTPADVAELDLTEALLELERSSPREALTLLDRVIRGADADADVARRAALARAEALTASGREEEARDAWRECAGAADTAVRRADVWQRRARAEHRRARPSMARESVEAMLREAGRWIDGAETLADRQERGRVSRGYVETALTVRLSEPGPPRWPEAARWFALVSSGRVPSESSSGEEESLRVSWFWGAGLVVALEDEATGALRPCGNPEELREWILLFRSLLGQPERSAERDVVGEWLRRALFAEAPAGGTTIRLQTDGPLAALPFAILPTPDGPLGLACPIVHGAPRTGSGAAGTDAPRDFLILADPAPSPGAPPEPLPGARQEARIIATRVSGARVLAGEAAAEARITGASQPTVLHVAAHSSPDPSAPALFLAPGQGRDGRLGPDEVRRLSRVPRIVVLSSCESLLTDVSGRPSTGAIGEAFLDAGVGTVVGALWSVEDRALGPFMAAFHAEIAAGLRPSEAMRRARLAASRSADPGVADPFGWAAFVVHGRDDAVRFAAPVSDEGRSGAESTLGYAAALAFAVLLLRTRRMR